MNAMLRKAILVATFDPASLLNRLVDAGCPIADLSADRPAEVYQSAGCWIQRDPWVERQFERFLDFLWRARMQEVAATDTEVLMTWCRTAELSCQHDMGGLIWALARDSRVELRKGLQLLFERLLKGALEQARMQGKLNSLQRGEISDPS